MCLLAWNWQPDSETPLLLLSNRDEYYQRAALPLHWWPGDQVLAGQDLQAGGTWLGVDRRGRLAALTNYRQAVDAGGNPPSRGALVLNFLQSNQDAPTYLDTLLPQTTRYKPFNLLVFDGTQLLGLESRHGRVKRFAPGIGGVSNADFDTPWPKLQRWKDGLQQHTASALPALPAFLPLMQDPTLATDAELPETGIARAWERALSAPFVRSPGYGTRACSVVTVRRTELHFFEQSHAATGPLSSALEIFQR